MANWASTSYVIEGPKDVLQKIEQAILKCPTDPEDPYTHWEGNVLEALGAKWTSREQDRDKGLYMRGFIYETPWWDKDGTVLRLDAEEAYGVTDFNEALEFNFPVRVYYVVEEQMEEIYATNDAEGKYFPERFYVDVCIGGEYFSEYFITKKEMFRYLSNITRGRVKKDQDVEDFNAQYEDSATDDENYIHIYEFSIV